MSSAPSLIPSKATAQRSGFCAWRPNSAPSVLERACEKAFQIRSPVYKTVKTMLEQRMEGAPLRAAAEAKSPAEETANALGVTNVRGSDYYH